MVAPTRIGIKEASTQLDALVDRSQQGEVIELLRNGQPVVRFQTLETSETVSSPSEETGSRLETLRSSIRAWQEARGQPPITTEEIVSWIREGREERGR